MHHQSKRMGASIPLLANSQIRFSSSICMIGTNYWTWSSLLQTLFAKFPHCSFCASIASIDYRINPWLGCAHCWILPQCQILCSWVLLLTSLYPGTAKHKMSLPWSLCIISLLRGLWKKHNYLQSSNIQFMQKLEAIKAYVQSPSQMRKHQVWISMEARVTHLTTFRILMK